MGEVIDFKTKKAYIPPPSYAVRSLNCINTYKTTGKPCECKTCLGKALIVSRLVAISSYLCLDYSTKNNDTLYYGDWYSIILAASMAVEDIVYPQV